MMKMGWRKSRKERKRIKRTWPPRELPVKVYQQLSTRLLPRRARARLNLRTSPVWLRSTSKLTAARKCWRQTELWSVWTPLNLTGFVFNCILKHCKWAAFLIDLVWIYLYFCFCRKRWSDFWRGNNPATQKRSSSCTTNTESTLANGCYSYSKWGCNVVVCIFWCFKSSTKCLCLSVCRLGFSVLVYGLGSKKALLEDFRESHLSQEIHLVVNGFFPSITLKSVSIHTHMKIFCINCIIK